MNLSRPSALLLAAGALAGLCALGTAQVERFTMERMLSQTTDAVRGEIIDSDVFKVDHPVDGPDLYYTELTVEGTSLRTGLPQEIRVIYPGGFIDAENGVYNSEAPSADDVKLGNEVIVFSKWLDNNGGDVAGNRLWASHGGLFRTFTSRRGGKVVQGRGDGYAVDSNVSMTDLSERITSILEKK
jgi:hypothetical protein